MYFKSLINDAFIQNNQPNQPAPLNEMQHALLQDILKFARSDDPLIKNLFELLKKPSAFTTLHASRSAYGVESDGKSYTLLTATIRNPAAGQDAVTFGLLLSAKREVVI